MSPVLPPLIVVTDGEGTRGRPLLDVVEAAIDGGARAVLLREKHLDHDQRGRLAQVLQALLAPVGGMLLVASDATIPSDGVHLAAVDPYPTAHSALVGRSCHGAADLLVAASQGCSYATLSPIFLTASKPGYGPALGPAALRDPPLPVWALGGVNSGNARSCLDAGASGVAVMGEVMRAEDPAVVTAALILALA